LATCTYCDGQEDLKDRWVEITGPVERKMVNGRNLSLPGLAVGQAWGADE